MEKQKDTTADEFRYQVKFNYNGQPYQIWLMSQKDLEVQLAEDRPRFIIDTVEGTASDWIKSEKLLMKGVKLQDVCLHHENGDLIANISKLCYE